MSHLKVIYDRAKESHADRLVDYLAGFDDPEAIDIAVELLKKYPGLTMRTT